MKINKDLVIEDTNTSLEDITDELSHLKPYVLYENETSASSTTSYTLSDSAANYKYLEIFYANNNYANMYLYNKVSNPNGKTVNLFSCGVGEDNGATLWICSGRYSISNKTISKVYEYGYRLTNGNWGLGGSIHAIRKVVGYK